jgi:thiosulfate dehydrogenase (quinone) large subunit
MLQKTSLFLLRISLGGLFFYAGITKIMDPEWSAAGYIGGAQNFPELYGFFLQDSILPLVNILNEWGLALLGASLILGIFVRYAAPLGVALMLLYYFALPFPQPNPHAYLVDEHVVYIFSLLTLMAFEAGRVWGLDGTRR